MEAEARRGARADPLVSRAHPLSRRSSAPPRRASTGCAIPTPFAVGRVNVVPDRGRAADAGRLRARTPGTRSTSCSAARRARPLARGHRAGDRHPPAHRPPRAGRHRRRALRRRGGRDRRWPSRSSRTSPRRPQADDEFAPRHDAAQRDPRGRGARRSGRCRGVPRLGPRGEVTRPLRDGEALELRDRTLHVHHRPGHCPTDTIF